MSLGSLDEGGTPAILKLIKDPSRMNQSFIIASMQRDKDKGGGGGKTAAFGGSCVGGLSHGSHVTKPKWKVSETLTFALSRSELVQDKNIIKVAMGINHTAFLTGRLWVNRLGYYSDRWL